MKRYLLISMAFPPKGAVGALRTYRLCRYLPQMGWLPEVITTRPWGITNRDSTLLDEIPGEVRVHRTRFFDPLLAYQRRWGRKGCEAPATIVPPVGASEHGRDLGSSGRQHRPFIGRLKRILIGMVSTPDHMIFWNLNLFVRGFRILWKNRSFEFILTSTPPHSSLLSGALLGRLFSIPHIVDLRDPWCGRYEGERSWLRNLVERTLEKWVVRHARMVISSTEFYNRTIRERFPECDPGKFVWITNCFEPEKFDRIEARQTDKFTICYLGIFYPANNPYPFFRALRQWLGANPGIRPDVELCLVGSGDPVTIQVIRDHGLEDVVRITGRVAHEKAIEETKSSDLLLLLMGVEARVSPGWVPAKLYEYLACRKPILAFGPEGEALSIVRRTGTGYTVTSDDTSGFIEILDREYRSKRGTAAGVREAPAVLASEMEKYSSEYTNQRFIEVFQAVSGCSAPGNDGSR
jgi:glycosyltransferase involved in cell wall biosynthesis